MFVIARDMNARVGKKFDSVESHELIDNNVNNRNAFSCYYKKETVLSEVQISNASEQII